MIREVILGGGVRTTVAEIGAGFHFPYLLSSSFYELFHCNVHSNETSERITSKQRRSNLFVNSRSSSFFPPLSLTYLPSYIVCTDSKHRKKGYASLLLSDCLKAAGTLSLE